MRIGKLAVLAAIVAGAVVALLAVTGVIQQSDVGEVALKTLGSLAILFAAALAWQAVRGKPSAPDRTDKPVP